MTNKELSRRVFEEIYTKGDVDLIPKTHDEHCRLRDPARDTILEGPETMRRYVEGLRTGFPDFRITIERQVAERDLVASQVVCQGTHKGPFMGLDPTNRRVNVRSLVIQQFKDDRVVEAEVMWDVLGLLQQLGLKPAEAIRAELLAAAQGKHTIAT